MRALAPRTGITLSLETPMLAICLLVLFPFVALAPLAVARAWGAV